LWFPVRFEKYNDRLFITAVDKNYPGLLRGKVTKIGNFTVEKARMLVGELISSANKYVQIRRKTDYLPNVIILEKTGIISSGDKLSPDHIYQDNSAKKVELYPNEWSLSFNRPFDKKKVPTNNETLSVLDDSTHSPPFILRVSNLSSYKPKLMLVMMFAYL
jgi:hypothetical protein